MDKILTANRASWDVLLIGGASGADKSSLSYPLARHFGVTVTEIDGLDAAVHSMTTAEQMSAPHYWDAYTEAANLSAEQILGLHRSVYRTLEPAVGAVVANHVESHMLVILEGDYLLPESASRPIRKYSEAKLKAIFLHEGDERQIVKNLLSREPVEGEQLGRAKVSWLFSGWIKGERGRLGLAALPARPWDDLLERAAEVLHTSFLDQSLLS